MKKLLFSAALCIVCLHTNSLLHAGNNEVTVLAKTALRVADISAYLTNLGYTLLSEPEQNDRDWDVHTSKNGNTYHTVVHTDGESIIEHEDVLL